MSARCEIEGAYDPDLARGATATFAGGAKERCVSRFFQLTLAAAALSLEAGLVAERRSRKATSTGGVTDVRKSSRLQVLRKLFCTC